MEIVLKKYLLRFSFFACFFCDTASRAEECYAETQTDMNVCASRNAESADQKLQIIYQKLNDKASPAGRQQLRASQSAWNDYQTRQCAFNSLGSIGGSVHSIIMAECRPALSRQQADILQRQLDCEEGDLSCGNQ